jgi:hypothetical protein
MAKLTYYGDDLDAIELPVQGDDEDDHTFAWRIVGRAYATYVGFDGKEYDIEIEAFAGGAFGWAVRAESVLLTSGSGSGKSGFSKDAAEAAAEKLSGSEAQRG